MKVEFVVSMSAVQKVWQCRFQQLLGIVTNAQELVRLHIDNQASIAFTKGPRHHTKTKHIV